MLAASGIRIDDPFLLVARLSALGGPWLVSGPADGSCHRPERGRHFTPFVQGSVASNVRHGALILHSQGEMKLSESGIAIAKWGAQGGGIYSALFSVLNSKENQEME